MAKSKRMKAPPRPTEKIHGKKVYIGTGTGERVGKKASGAIKERKRKMKELEKLLMED